MGQYFFPDIKFITDEKFDFGLSSPSDSREEERVEEEEVRHIERGVAQRLDLNVQQREGVGRSRECLARWSPLSAEKLDEIVKEANRLAVQLERCSLREKENASAGPLGAARASPRSPRRETFVVKNSPVRALLPTVEPGKLLPLGKSPSPCARAAPPPASDTSWAAGGLASQSKVFVISFPSCKVEPVPLELGSWPCLWGNCLNGPSPRECRQQVLTCRDPWASGVGSLGSLKGAQSLGSHHCWAVGIPKLSGAVPGQHQAGGPLRSTEGLQEGGLWDLSQR
uniref:G2 and S phase-expressed protein 1 N-terminal domain-containing protein n=1 Tax=Chelydra serpentina TaxID=8475 RepID=A0A8C3SR10_CHESE